MAEVSVRDVARLAGVSVGTVSNAMNHPEKVSEAARARVQKAIDQLGFVRNDVARQLRVGRSLSIGLVVLDVRNPFFTEVARGAEHAAAAAGLSVLLGNSDEDAERESGYLDLFEQQRTAGVLLSPLGAIDDRLARLRARGTPVVLVDRLGQPGVVSSVSVDDVAGGRLAVEHLAGLGRRRIVFVGAPGIRQVDDRLVGAQAAAAAAGARLEVIELASQSVLEGRRVGAELVARSERPDAVFAANDLVAMGVLQALRLQGADVRVPEDVALIGYDDIDFAAAAVVPLSSIRQPAQLIGSTAVELLLAESRDPEAERRQVVFQPELVVRESTAGAT